jgi:hypothetical protein
MIVRLLEDHDEVPSGCVGTVLEHFEDGTCEVEFMDEDGSVHYVILPESQIVELKVEKDNCS